MTTSAPERVSRLRVLGIAVLVLAALGLSAGFLLIFSWSIDETHFDRPSAEFDAFADEVAAVPGVGVVEKERWVEAPAFWSPMTSLRVTVERSALPAVLDLACASGYPDPVDWGLTVRTPSRTEVSVFAEPVASGCPDFRLDVVPTVDAVDRLAPGRIVQAAVWEDGRLAFSDLLDGRSEMSSMVPFVAAADDLRRAAGVEADRDIEISGPRLTAVPAPGESAAYAAMLRTLIDEYGVTDFWDGAGGGTPIDGVARTQIMGDPATRESVEAAVRASGLRLADAPVVFREY
ncbi:hypothetical protein [Microbacterium sp. T32]|uniref:hypothetical protein n=5 Tax=Bacteria TaxID=2 RepID=UPI0007ABBA78|nr:hypothetical protein [Microbacterium sp. T32]KZE42294.1 hypothetical protein AVW09_10340 [Microbacterium sp. T32]